MPTPQQWQGPKVIGVMSAEYAFRHGEHVTVRVNFDKYGRSYLQLDGDVIGVGQMPGSSSVYIVHGTEDGTNAVMLALNPDESVTVFDLCNDTTGPNRYYIITRD
jgi:hypothetical protein